MRQILVPCDFSTPAINAFLFALKIAGKSQATVHLMHAIELPVIIDPVVGIDMTFEGAYIAELKTDTIKRFNKLRQDFLEEAKGIEILSTLKFGSVASSILEYANSASIDLITIGSHGAHGLRELFIGSIAEKIVRRSRCPVFVIKHRFAGTVKDIIFPNSFVEENQERLMKEVKDLQKFFNAKLHLLHINTPENFSADAVTFSQIQSFAKHFELSNYEMNVYNSPHVEQGIIEFSRKIGTSIIAIGTHSNSGIVHLINGSIAEDLINHNRNLVWTCSMHGQSMSDQVDINEEVKTNP